MKMLLLSLLAGVALTYGNPLSKDDVKKLREEMASVKDQLTGMKDVINVNKIVDEAKMISSEMKANDVESLEHLASLGDELEGSLKDMEKYNVKFNAEEVEEEMDEIMQNVKNKVKTKAKDENYLSSLITSAKKTIADTTDDTESKIKSVKELNSIISDFSTTLTNLKAEKADLDIKSFKDEIEIVKKDAENKFQRKQNKKNNDVNDYLFGLARDAKEIVAGVVVNDDAQLSQTESLNKLKDIQSEFKNVVKDASEKHIDLEYKNLYDQLKDVEKGVDSILLAKHAKETKDEPKSVEKVNDNDYLLDLTHARSKEFVFGGAQSDMLPFSA